MGSNLTAGLPSGLGVAYRGHRGRSAIRLCVSSVVETQFSANCPHA